MSARSAVLPFLLLAYPLSYVLIRGNTYCEPFCIAPPSHGSAVGISAVLTCDILAVAIARALLLAGFSLSAVWQLWVLTAWSWLLGEDGVMAGES